MNKKLAGPKTSLHPKIAASGSHKPVQHFADGGAVTQPMQAQTMQAQTMGAAPAPAQPSIRDRMTQAMAGAQQRQQARMQASAQQRAAQEQAWQQAKQARMARTQEFMNRPSLAQRQEAQRMREIEAQRQVNATRNFGDVPGFTFNPSSGMYERQGGRRGRGGITQSMSFADAMRTSIREEQGGRNGWIPDLGN